MAITGAFRSARGELLPYAYVNLALNGVSSGNAIGLAYIFRSASERVRIEGYVEFQFEPDWSEDAPNLFAQGYAALRAMNWATPQGQEPRFPGAVDA